jgi:NhaP-type Na+/H+ or K+/H+ antiporter
MMRAGMELELKGKVTFIVMLSIIPSNIEANIDALAAYLILDIPYLVALALGYVLSAVGLTVTIPCAMDI